MGQKRDDGVQGRRREGRRVVKGYEQDADRKKQTGGPLHEELSPSFPSSGFGFTGESLLGTS